MKTIKWLLFTITLVISGAVFARTSVPVVDFLDQPVATSSGKALTLGQVQDIIRKVAGEKKWVVTSNPNGVMLASLAWKANKHTIMVQITVTPDHYSIKYNNSINMKYEISSGENGIPSGQQIIHPYYNRFVNELREGIRVELTKY